MGERVVLKKYRFNEYKVQIVVEWGSIYGVVEDANGINYQPGEWPSDLGIYIEQKIDKILATDPQFGGKPRGKK